VGGSYSTYRKETGAYRILVGNVRKRKHCANPRVDERIILIRILNKIGGRGLDLGGTG
jgi:hypothetical protein